MKTSATFIYITLLASSVHAIRTLFVKNNCPHNVWPVVYTAPGAPPQDHASGWLAAPNTSVSFNVPETWKGRIWGRTQCDFTAKPGTPACATGDCGALECQNRSGTPPTTLAEFALATGAPPIGQKDDYDVSLLNGFNLPISITNDAKCDMSHCPVNLNPLCPTPLALPVIADTKEPAGCQTSCQVDMKSSPASLATQKDCCMGPYENSTTCLPTTIQHGDFFSGHCPNAFTYEFDPQEWSCGSSMKANYTVTFCP